MYINAILAMLNGGTIGRDINSYTVNYCLDKILEDFGEDALKTAQGVCMRRYEETKRRGSTRQHYRYLAEQKRQHPKQPRE